MRSKTLHQSNLVFLFSEHAQFIPENSLFGDLYFGNDAAGMNFMDDPALRMKVLSVPAKGLQIVWEGSRLRVEDTRAALPQESSLVKDALYVAQKLVPGNIPIRGIGFNYDVIIQFDRVLRMNDLFASFAPGALAKTDTLVDFGVSWTASSKDAREITKYFTKITAPLELAAHANYHFVREQLPNEEELAALFKTKYDAIDAVIDGLNL